MGLVQTKLAAYKRMLRILERLSPKNLDELYYDPVVRDHRAKQALEDRKFIATHIEEAHSAYLAADPCASSWSDWGLNYSECS